MNKDKKTVFIKTFGCQMNIRDSEYVIGLLLENGFGMANSMDEADIILFNSCSVRKHAEDRLISNIADLRGLKKSKPGLIIGLIGCTAQSYKEDILKKAPIIDLSCGPGNEGDLPDIINKVIKDRYPIIAADKVNQKKPELFPKYREGQFKAYVSISEGCDNFCSYCVVPYVRGRERSRNANDIIKEVSDLAQRGFKEVTLLGQNVNSYRGSNVKGQGSEFVGLLNKLNGIEGIERIRFMTSHPKDASMELFKATRDLDKVCEHLHLPLQSGSNRILKMMNRKYTRKKYLGLIEAYRKLVPQGSITTDMIVGFPSESDKDFKDTYNMMKEIGYDGAFTFKYSPRPPAKASGLKDDVPKDVKEARLKMLIDFQCEISRMRNEPLNGKILEVLVDAQNERNPGMLTGRTRANKAAIFEGGKTLIGKLVNVKVESIKPHTLIGRMTE